MIKTNSIFDFQPTSLIDFPGTVSTVLFLGGCNLKCPYCHNPDVVYKKKKTESEVFFNFLKKRKGKIEGVVITGGEPTIHKDLKYLMEDIKELGFKIKLDTNGLLPGVIEKCLPYIDYLAVDVKTFCQKYPIYLRSSFDYEEVEERLEHSVDFVRQKGEDSEIRVTAVSEFLDRSYCHWIGKLCLGVEKLYLQKTKKGVKTIVPYYGKSEPVSEEKLEEYKEIFLQYVKSCKIR